MVYLEDGNVVPVDKSELPIELPNDIDLNSSGNPLDARQNGNLLFAKNRSKSSKRDRSLDTFVDSSWYFLVLLPTT